MQELLRLARRVNAQPLTGPSDKQHGIKLPPGAEMQLELLQGWWGGAREDG